MSDADDTVATEEPEYVTREEYERRHKAVRDRMWKLFLLSAAVSSLAAGIGYVKYAAVQRAQVQANRTTALQQCLSGGELRVAIAKGTDDLRRLAAGLKPDEAPKGRVLVFIRATQPAVDELLTQAAYGTKQEARGRTFSAPLPPGTVSQAVIEEVGKLSEERCERRVAVAYGQVPSSG